jgi:hypothetical protein
MTTFPAGLSALELDIRWVRGNARDDAGASWETEDADPYWTGRLSTSKLNDDRLQDWEGFVSDAVAARLEIEFIDPIYRIPAAYRTTGLPGAYAGTGVIVNVTNPAAPVFSGLPLGLVLRRGDRLNLVDGARSSYHRLRADVTVASGAAQALPIVPYALDHVFGPGDGLLLLDPKVKLNIVANSWSAPRRARMLTVASCSLEEASLT